MASINGITGHFSTNDSYESRRQRATHSPNNTLRVAADDAKIQKRDKKTSVNESAGQSKSDALSRGVCRNADVTLPSRAKASVSDPAKIDKKLILKKSFFKRPHLQHDPHL